MSQFLETLETYGGGTNQQTYGGSVVDAISNTSSNPQATIAAVSAVASFVPVVGPILGAIGGIVSGFVKGASTNPSKEMNDVFGYSMPIIESKFASINENNLSQSLSWIDGYISFLETAQTHLREHHARASDTKKAYETVLSKLRELRPALIGDTIKKIEAAGGVVTKTAKSEDFNVLENTYSYHSNLKFDTNHKYTVRWTQFDIVLPRPEEVKQIEVVKTVEGDQEIISTNINPQKASSGGFMALLVLFGIG
jgi:hypothetical protein